jgi:hypothetical protein
MQSQLGEFVISLVTVTENPTKNHRMKDPVYLRASGMEDNSTVTDGLGDDNVVDHDGDAKSDPTTDGPGSTVSDCLIIV